MKFFKKVLCAAAAVSALSYPLAVKAMKTPELTNAATAAMANMDVVVNNDFELLTNPALMEYSGTKFSFPGLNLRLNNPVEAIESIGQYQELFGNLGSSGEGLDSVLSFLESRGDGSLVAGLSAVPLFQLSTRIGTFGIAVYGVNETVVSTNKKAFESMAELHEYTDYVKEGPLLDEIKQGNIPENREFVIVRPVSALSISDAGAALGYAKKFEIKDIVDISAGVNLRLFERVMVDFGPSARLAVNFDSIRKGHSSINSREDLEALLGSSLDLKDNLALDPKVVTGFGCAMDLGLVLSKKFWVMDVMLGASVKNAPANMVSYSDGTLDMDKFEYGVGLASHPLVTFPVLRGLLVAVEMHGIGVSQSYHMGVSWKFGGGVSVTPKVGFQVGKFDIAGHYHDVNTFTAGADLDLVVMKLAANYALDTDSNYQLGAGLTFGYEWDK